MSNTDWKNETPRDFKSKNGKNLQFGAQNTPQSVLFVPNSNNGVLLKRLEQREPPI